MLQVANFRDFTVVAFIRVMVCNPFSLLTSLDVSRILAKAMLAVILKNGFLAKLLNLWIFFLWEILGQNNDSSGNVTEAHCWNNCLCYNLTIRCLLVGLTQVPTNLSHTTNTL